jgi:hypothetical protein
MFYICMREVLGSNLDPESGCPETFRGFTQSLQANAGIVTRLDHDRSFKIFSNSLSYILGHEKERNLFFLCIVSIECVLIIF